ncbi:hypothetical protein [Thermogemmatispora sp.]|uniref:hypothetical protein n=1 Tax=Thermogemmatispora sp. TaxID=1968838 RepID=UPI001DA35C5F|nr:hypothetical protein [Thermogemmatispora sp.]MBX5451930.1 hypothetical protein [Thermogemmatispora sp.]
MTRPGIACLIFLCLLLTACNASISIYGGGAGIRQATATPTPQRSIPMPATQTSCPSVSPSNPLGTRAAVMRPLGLGSHQNLVYVYNEGQPQISAAHGHLVRYDITTSRRVTIATSGLRISEAQVSADGQWIMFLSLPDPHSDPNHVALLQMVRLDGQGLQTLYCFPKLPYTPEDGIFSAFQGRGILSYAYPPLRFIWSPDERHVLLSADLEGTTSLMTLLDIRTGSLRQLLLYSQYCRLAIPLTWLDSNQAYIVTEGRATCGSPPPPMDLYLLNIAKSTNPVDPQWNAILSQNVRFTEASVDISPDSSHLFTSTCEMTEPFVTTIIGEPARGGAQTIIYHQLASAQNPESCVESIRATAKNALLMLIHSGRSYLQCGENSQQYRDAFQLATLSTAGHSQPRILANLERGRSYSLGQDVPTLWSLVSRDSRFYAITAARVPTTCSQRSVETMILYGRLSGGAPVVVVRTSAGTVDVVGWTAL